MARSEEALKRRAEKRQRTVEEQREVDLDDVKKRQKKKLLATATTTTITITNNNKNGSTNNNTNTSSISVGNGGGDDNDNDNDIRMKEVGAWKCQQCGNDNFASRRWCNSKTCNEPRPPAHITVAPPRPPHSRSREREMTTRSFHPLDEPGAAWTCNSCGNKNFASREKCYNRSCAKPRPTTTTTTTTDMNNNSKKHKPRHDEATSKKLIWSNQADKATMLKNFNLRKVYLETNNGEGMDLKDIERAKILIARDERKREKKIKKKQKNTDESSPAAAITDPPSSPNNNNKAAAATVVTTEEEEATREEPKKTKSSSSGSGSVEKSKRDKNKTLRKLYEETGGKGMRLDQIERAKQLIERDERKRQKKEKQQQQQQQQQQQASR